MDTSTIYKPPIHKHLLFPSSRFISSECGGCHVYGYMHGYYFCNDPYCDDRLFHKKCVEAPLEIDHPSHPQHPLMLTTYSGDGPCDLCGQNLYGPCYSCSTCGYKVDLSCGMKPSPPAIKYPVCHDHSLVYSKKGDDELPCELCKESIGGPSYSCLECKNMYFHVECIYFSKEVIHCYHPNHPLKLIASHTLMHDAEMCCLSCGKSIEKVMCHCFICNFSMCLVCTRDPPPRVIEHIKTHKHPLNCFLRRISYTCDVCGGKGDTRPYLCFQCGFTIHGQCIDLPRVINTNRHNHRIYFTHHLGVGYSKCGVCRQNVSRYHAAYYCSVCPNYIAHSACALQSGVWDCVELEGTPNDTEDFAPFKVVGESLISHFSHEKHTLRLHKDNTIYGMWLRCEACIHPVGFDSMYVCEECDFFLHEKCANLPRKKRIVYDIVLYTLEVVGGVNACKMCRTLSTGFKYTSQDGLITDVHCGSLSEPLIHDGHLHPLYFYENDGRCCNGCDDIVDGYVFRCDACDFYLCFYCACLPEKIWHWSDEHHLTLFCGGKESDNNWCDNCENELDSSKWFYTCFVCGVTLHTRCVLGDFSRLKLEEIIVISGKRIEVVANNHNTRPFCRQCNTRCKISPYLKVCNEDNVCICSLSCFLSYMWLIKI